ncbi:peptidase domain-containing ABC transporter [Rhizomonospora bruguierae]|uniref:peptidase domain-containing ABC transporter n=1 Tax=Rhizomonospora bruguierae TaxID=1581705 RepID=UPI001BCF7E0A|nr:peptidase domain-containing ABC transporter [Micromonospora sp. NBRC 107566]
MIRPRLGVASRPGWRRRLVEQLNQTECGLCCCAMLLDLAGHGGSMPELRQRYHVGRDGLTVANLVTVLAEQGATPHVYRTGAAGVATLGGPAICHWQRSHFVVVVGFDARGVTLLDPGAGRRRVTPAEFVEGFSGLAVTVDPPARRRRAARPPAAALLARFARERVALLALVLALSLGAALVPMAIPKLLARLFDGAGGSFSAGLPLLGIGLAFALVLFLRTVVGVIASVAVGRSMSRAVFDRLLRLPYAFHENRGPGELIFTLDSVQQLRALICTDLIQVAVGGVLSLVLLGWLGLVSVAAMLLTVALVAALVGCAVLAGGAVRRFAFEETRARADLQSTQISAVSGLETIKTNGMEADYVEMWQRRNDAVQRRFASLQMIQGGFSSLTAGIMFVGPIVILAQAARTAGATVATLVAVQALTGVLLAQVNTVVGSFTRVAQAGALLVRIADVLLRPADDTFRSEVAVRPEGAIEVDRAWFGYATFSRPVVRGASLSIPAGAKVAIVGASGCGKSTLARLLVGLHRPTSGRITIGGVDLGAYDRERFYDAVAYVPQNVVLGHGTVRDNIAWGRGAVDDDAVREAARRVGLDEQISALPLGYDTPVATLGQNFSGGQRQRIALARAAFKRATIVVLDEATSSLDNLSEAVVTAYFDSLPATRVIIAHRLTSVVDADLIVVMRDGTVAETGTHAELCARGGLYRALYARDRSRAGAPDGADPGPDDTTAGLVAPAVGS